MSTPTIGSTQFQVDLQQLGDAVQSVGAQATTLKETVGAMQLNFQFVASAWTTPTSGSFEPIEEWFNSAAGQLSDLLDEITSRLQQAYDTYVAAEQTNTGNAGG